MLVKTDMKYFPNLAYTGPTDVREQRGSDFLAAAGAGFMRESPLANLGFMLPEEDEIDPLFNMEERARQSEAFQFDPEAFIGTRNFSDFRTRELRVLRDKGRIEEMQRSGFGAFIGGFAGGLLSPTNAIPIGGAYRGARTAKLLEDVMRVGAQAAGAASIDEYFLQQNQELRTSGEAFANVAGAFVLGGLLGGAVSGLSKKEVMTIAEDMAKGQSRITILPLESRSSTVGAKQVEPEDPLDALPEVGGISKSVPGMAALGRWISPVAENLQMRWSGTIRALTASLDSGGLHVEGLASLGGDVASLRKQYDVLLYDALYKRKEIMKDPKNNQVAAMGVRRFSEEVSSALRDGGEHPIPAVAEYAKWVRENFYNPLLKEAISVGMKGFDKIDEDFIGKYANRIAREGLAIREHDKLFEVLREHFVERLSEDWGKRLDRVQELNKADEQAAEDIALNKAEVLGLRAKLEGDIYNLPDQFPDVRDLALEIRRLREEAKNVSDRAKATELRAKANELDKTNKEKLGAFRKAEDKLKQRFSRLGRSAFGRETAQGKAVKQIEALTERMDRERDLLLSRVEKVLDRVDDWSRDKFETEIERLQDVFRNVYKKWTETNAKLAKLGYDLPEDFRHLEMSDPRRTDKASQLGLEERLARQQQEMEDVLARLDEMKEMTPEVAQEALRNMARQIIKGNEEANVLKRQRIAKLNERLADLDPEKARLESAFYRERAMTRMENLVQRAADKNIRLVDGKFNVEKLAEEHSNYFANLMMGQRQSMPFFKALEERGPELARMLDIDETRVWSNGYKFEYFLERDAEYLMRAYARTLSPDIELMRKFKTVNPMSPDSPFGKKIVQEFDEARREASKIENKKEREKTLDRIAKDQERAFRNVNGIIDRIRFVRGLPPDPMDPTYRAGKFLRNLNVLRMMGKTTIASLPDLAGIVLKYGLLRTFRDGFVPLVSDLQRMKMSAKEARAAGLGLDMALHGRAAAMYDVMDETRAGTKLERGVQWATNNFGVLTLMDAWNTNVKYLASSITLPRLSEAVEARANGTATAKQLRYLNRLGLGDGESKLIWNELASTGDRVDGIMFPNTGEWRNRDAQRMFRAALAREVDDMIVTPGAERPLFSDGSELGRLLFQFRTFTFSSHQKLVWAGMQDLRSGELAPASGAIFSLALGALSYYLWAVASGGERLAKMQSASPEKWAAEAVSRSFILGALSEVQRVAENVPGPIGQAATFGTGATSRSSFRGPVQAVLGPSTSYITDGNAVLQGFLGGDFTQQDARALRRLLPYNNLWALSRAFSQVEKVFSE